MQRALWRAARELRDIVFDMGPAVRGGDAVAEEVKTLVALPEPRANIAAAMQFRSTWIVSSLDGLRHAGHFERYQSLLGPHRDQILTCVAGAWLPIEVAYEHYLACDQLLIGDPQYIEMSRAASQVRKAWHAALIAGAERSEATARTVLMSLPRVWARTTDGGAVGVSQLAPTQARIDYVACQLLDVPYFRRAVRIMAYMLLGRVCTGLSVREEHTREPACCSYLVQWE